FSLYTFQYFSGTNVRVYHEGMEGWTATGHTVSRDAAKLPPVSLKLQINPTAAVTTKEMIAKLNNPDVQIIDARTPQEFAGEDIRAIRGGHIPGAVIFLTNRTGWTRKLRPSWRAKRSVTIPACRSSGAPT